MPPPPAGRLRLDRVERVTPADRGFAVVRHIRGSAYGQAGQAVADGYDETCEVFLGWVGDEPVGTVRCCPCPDVWPSDYARYGAALSVLPPLSTVVTASRAAILPRYQQRGLLRALVEICEGRARVHQRGWLVGGASRALLPVYERLGFVRTGARYQSLLGSENELLVRAVLSGAEPHDADVCG